MSDPANPTTNPVPPAGNNPPAPNSNEEFLARIRAEATAARELHLWSARVTEVMFDKPILAADRVPNGTMIDPKKPTLVILPGILVHNEKGPPSDTLPKMMWEEIKMVGGGKAVAEGKLNVVTVTYPDWVNHNGAFKEYANNGPNGYSPMMKDLAGAVLGEVKDFNTLNPAQQKAEVARLQQTLRTKVFSGMSMGSYAADGLQNAVADTLKQKGFPPEVISRDIMPNMKIVTYSSIGTQQREGRPSAGATALHMANSNDVILKSNALDGAGFNRFDAGARGGTTMARVGPNEMVLSVTMPNEYVATVPTTNPDAATLRVGEVSFTGRNGYNGLGHGPEQFMDPTQPRVNESANTFDRPMTDARVTGNAVRNTMTGMMRDAMDAAQAYEQGKEPPPMPGIKDLVLKPNAPLDVVPGQESKSPRLVHMDHVGYSDYMGSIIPDDNIHDPRDVIRGELADKTPAAREALKVLEGQKFVKTEHNGKIYIAIDTTGMTQQDMNKLTVAMHELKLTPPLKHNNHLFLHEGQATQGIVANATPVQPHKMGLALNPDPNATVVDDLPDAIRQSAGHVPELVYDGRLAEEKKAVFETLERIRDGRVGTGQPGEPGAATPTDVDLAKLKADITKLQQAYPAERWLDIPLKNGDPSSSINKLYQDIDHNHNKIDENRQNAERLATRRGQTAEPVNEQEKATREAMVNAKRTINQVIQTEVDSPSRATSPLATASALDKFLTGGQRPGFSKAGNITGVYGGINMLLHDNQTLPDCVRVVAGTAVTVGGAGGLAADVASGRYLTAARVATAAGNEAEALALAKRSEAAMKLAGRIAGPVTAIMAPIDAYQAYEEFKKGHYLEGGQHTAQATSGTLILTSIIANGTKVAAVTGPVGVVIAIGATTLDIGMKSYQIYETAQDTNAIGKEIVEQNAKSNNPGASALYTDYLKENAGRQVYRYEEPKIGMYKNAGSARALIKRYTGEDYVGNDKPDHDKLVGDIDKSLAALNKEREEIIKRNGLEGRLEDATKRNGFDVQTGATYFTWAGGANPKDIERLNSIDVESKALRSHRAEINGGPDGTVPGTRGIISYRKILTERKNYEDTVKKLEPEVPKLQASVQMLDDNNRALRGRVEDLQYAYRRNIGELPPNTSEYDQAKNLRTQLDNAVVRDKGDKLAPILAINAKLDELKAEPANLAKMQQELISRTYEQAKKNNEKLKDPEVNRQEASLKQPIKDEKLEGMRKDLEGAAKKYAEAQRDVERQKADMLKRFGDEEKQLALLEAKNPEFLAASKELQRKMDISTVSYVEAIGTEKRFSEQRETLIKQAYTLQTYRDTSLDIRVVSTDTDREALQRADPIRYALSDKKPLTRHDLKLAHDARAVSMEFTASQTHADMLKEELKSLGIRASVSEQLPKTVAVPKTFVLEVSQAQLEDYVKKHPEKSAGNKGGLTLKLRSGKSITFDDPKLMRVPEAPAKQPKNEFPFGRKPAARVIEDPLAIVAVDPQPKESGLSVVPPPISKPGLEGLLAVSEEQQLFDRLAEEEKIRYITQENLAPVALTDMALKMRLNLAIDENPADKELFKPVYTISGTPEEMQKIKDTLTAKKIPFAAAMPQTEPDIARFGKSETIIIDAAAIKKYLPQTGLTRSETSQSLMDNAAHARDKKQTAFQLDVNNDGKVDLKDFDRNGDGKLSLSDFTDSKGKLTTEAVKDMQQKINLLGKLQDNPELKKIRDAMMAIAAENNIPLTGGGITVPQSLPAGKGSTRTH